MEESSAVAGVAPRQFKSKLEEALTAKQESEAKVASLENKVKQYESEVGELKERVWNLVDHLKLEDISIRRTYT